MKYFLFLLLSSAWAIELLIDIPVYAVGNIAGKQYAVDSQNIYYKTDVYRQIYHLPEPIQAAQIKNAVLTPRYTVSVNQRCQVTYREQQIVTLPSIITVARPAVIIATANTVFMLDLDGIKLGRQDGGAIRLIDIDAMSADDLAQVRLSYIEYKQKKFLRVDRDYVRLLYFAEAKKRREGPHDAYTLTLPQ